MPSTFKSAPGAQGKSPYDYGRRREDVMCRVLGLEYNMVQRFGVLWLAPDNCTDMQGAIEMFQAIDPEVSMICTFQVDADLRKAGIPDTAYVRDPRDGKWTAIPGEIASHRLAGTGLLPLRPSKIITEMPACGP